jgi:hypothetical protein
MKRYFTWENGTDKRKKLQANNHVETSFVRNIERPADNGRRASTVKEAVMITAKKMWSDNSDTHIAVNDLNAIVVPANANKSSDIITGVIITLAPGAASPMPF